MNDNAIEISGALKTNLETIKAYNCLGLATGYSDRVIIREACNNVHNYLMRLELNERGTLTELNCLHSGYYWMSTKRFKAWEEGTKTGGIKEHVVPFKIVRKGIANIVEQGGSS